MFTFNNVKDLKDTDSGIIGELDTDDDIKITGVVKVVNLPSKMVSKFGEGSLIIDYFIGDGEKESVKVEAGELSLIPIQTEFYYEERSDAKFAGDAQIKRFSSKEEAKEAGYVTKAKLGEKVVDPCAQITAIADLTTIDGINDNSLYEINGKTYGVVKIYTQKRQVQFARDLKTQMEGNDVKRLRDIVVTVSTHDAGKYGKKDESYYLLNVKDSHLIDDDLKPVVTELTK